MTDPTEAILTYLRHMGAGPNPDFLQEARVMSSLLMEIEVTQESGADRYERLCEVTGQQGTTSTLLACYRGATNVA